MAQILAATTMAALAVGVCRPSFGQSCPSDLSGDGAVTGHDVALLLLQWGNPGSADLDGSGAVGGADLDLLLGGWGPCLSGPQWATVLESAPNPAVVTDAALRERIVATGLPWRVRHTLTGIEMLLVPPGTFQMGCSPSVEFNCLQGSGAHENPVHTVNLTNAFYLGRYEVTQAQWVGRQGANPSYFQASNQFPGSDSRPVENVSFLQAQSFLSSSGLRLPTEAEWEFACRAGTATAFHNNSNSDLTAGQIAWYLDNQASVPQTKVIGLKAANRLGFHDMSGNVWEWVQDWWATYPSSTQTNPQGPATGLYRVQRGGCFNDGTDQIRSSFRGYDGPTFSKPDSGFRAARNP